MITPCIPQSELLVSYARLNGTDIVVHTQMTTCCAEEITITVNKARTITHK